MINLSPSLSPTSHSRPSKLCHFLSSFSTFPLFFRNGPSSACSIFLLPSPESSQLPWVNDFLFNFQDSGIFSSRNLFLTLSTFQVSGVESGLQLSYHPGFAMIALNSPLLPWFHCLEGRNVAIHHCDYTALCRAWHTTGLQWMSRKRKTPDKMCLKPERSKKACRRWTKLSSPRLIL